MLLSVNEGFKNKQPKNKYAAGDKSANKSGWTSRDIDVDGLQQAVSQGYAIAAQFEHELRSNANFKISGFLAVDIDTGLTLEEALTRPMVVDKAALLYTTASHTDASNKFRIIFELETPITDPSQYTCALAGLIQHFNSDRSCRDPARMFYGCTTAKFNRFDKILSAADVQVLIEEGRVALVLETDSIVVESELESKGTSVVTNQRVQNAFSLDDLAINAAGESFVIRDMVGDQQKIHCPRHNDTNPSATLFRTKKAAIGIRCFACQSTFWPSTELWKPEFYWTESYEQMALQHYNEQGFFSAGHDESGDDHEDGNNFDGNDPPLFRVDGSLQVRLFDHRYLPRLKLSEGISLIRSPKGTGKTEQLEHLVGLFAGDGKKILVVGHRKLLLSSIAKRLRLPLYSSPNGKKEFMLNGCLVVTVDSLVKWVTPRQSKFDVVIIDESEQVVAHFAGDTLKRGRNQSLTSLAFLARGSAHLIFADADLGILTQGFIRLVMDGAQIPTQLISNLYINNRADSVAPNVSTSAATGDATINSNVATVHIYPCQASLVGKLFEELRSGHRCAVATNSKGLAEILASMVNSTLAQVNSLLITADTKALSHVESFIKAPASEALKYDLIIYSPVLSTGVDITFPNNSQEIRSVFGFFDSGITTHFDIDQQLSRVRNPEEIHVWVSSKQGWEETEPLSIKEELLQTRATCVAESIRTGVDGVSSFVSDDEPLIDLMALITSVRRASINDLKANFIELRERGGWVVVHEAGLATPKLPLTGNQAAQLVLATNVCGASKIDTDMYDLYRHKADRGGLSDIELYRMNRYEIEDLYGATITPELAELDDKGRFRERYRNLEILLKPLATLQKLDLEEVRSGRTPLDLTNWARRHGLLTSLLSVAGIYSEASRFNSQVEITSQSLTNFAAAVERHAAELKTFFRMKIRGDLVRCPVLQLNVVLREVGLRVVQTRFSRAGGPKAYFYKLDSERWNLLSSLSMVRMVLEGDDLAQKQSQQPPDPNSTLTKLQRRASQRTQPPGESPDQVRNQNQDQIQAE